MHAILVAEDDLSLNKLICTALERAGYHAHAAMDGLAALEALRARPIDLLICDVMMPRMDGFTLVRQLRREGSLLPVLMVTAKGTQEDKREGFATGTDDYMVKPVDIHELLWRVAALLRRTHVLREKRLVVGEVVMDYDSLTVTTRDEVFELPPKEFYLLFTLLSAPKRIFTRQQLLDEVWGRDAMTDERTVDVHIKRLRDKFEELPDFTIVTVRGLGYKAEKNA